jgi:hypothetical protein
VPYGFDSAEQSGDLLSYPASSKSSNRSIKSRAGKTYMLSLIPELDTEDHPVVLGLVLHGTNRHVEAETSLLDATGK